jgi:mannosylfructose-phosphate synthase
MGGDQEEMEKKFNFRHRISEELRIFRSVNGQSLTSKVQLEKLNELYDFEAPNIEIIPPGVDVHKYTPPGEYAEPNSKLPGNYIYTISRLDTNKGHDLLLDAFAIVAKKIPDVNLVIGGGSPDPKPREVKLLDKINDIISGYGLAGRVQMIGYVPDEDMLPNYQFGRFFILPSLFEPFGMTTQEAMACGKAVIASKLGGIRNVLDHGKTGLLVDPSDKHDFAAAMTELLEDEQKCKLIGKNAHQLIMDEFSWEAIAGRHLAFYNDFL